VTVAPVAPQITSQYTVDTDQSAILVEARSNVGPIQFGSQGLTGWADARVVGGQLDLASSPHARFEIALDSLQSGNGLYDAELARRLHVRLHPVCTLELSSVSLLCGDTYDVAGTLEFHGVTNTLTGTIELSEVAPGTLVVTGDQVFDIRDFELDPPKMLMLHIYPDVRIQLHLQLTENLPWPKS
jgi:polyisoprenoid-binding protein YceI